ncbi:hypothetical protein ABPG74_012010 [Tetrahymena malaccensis]
MKSKPQSNFNSLSIYESTKGQANNSSIINNLLNYSMKNDEQERGQALTQSNLSQSFQNDYLNAPINQKDRTSLDPSQFFPNLKGSRIQELLDSEKNENNLSSSNGNISYQEAINVKTTSSSVSKHSPDKSQSAKKNTSLGPQNMANNHSNIEFSNQNQQVMNFPSLQKENNDKQTLVLQKIKANNSKKGNNFRIKKSAYLFSQNNMPSPLQGYQQQFQANQQQILQMANQNRESFNFQMQQQQILQQIQAQQQILQQIQAKVPQQQGLNTLQANAKGSQIIQQLKKSYLSQFNKQSEKQSFKSKYVGDEYGLQGFQGSVKTNGLFIDNRNQINKKINTSYNNNINNFNNQYISASPPQNDTDRQQEQQQQIQVQQYNTIASQQVRSISQNQRPANILRNQKSLKDLNERSVNEFDGFINTKEFFSTKQKKDNYQQQQQKLEATINQNSQDQGKETQSTLQQHKFLQVISNMNSKGLKNQDKLQSIIGSSSDRRNTSHSISKVIKNSTSNRRISNLANSSKNKINLSQKDSMDDKQQEDQLSIVSGQTTKNEIEEDLQNGKTELQNLLKIESDQTYHLISQLRCVELKPLYAKQRQQFHKRVLVIHFESVFLTQSNQYFWENWSTFPSQNQGEGGGLNQNNMGLNGTSAQSQLAQENFFAKFRTDLKRFMKNLCKKYTVILIFQGRKRSKDLFHYLLRMNYLFDGAYQMEELDCSKQDITRSPALAINYNYIISDFYKQKKPNTFTVIDCVSSEFILPNSKLFIDSETQLSSGYVEKSNMHYFTQKIPKVKISQHKIRVILMKNRQYSPKYPDCNHLMEVINSGEKKELLKNSQIISYALKMNKIIQQNLSNLQQKNNINNYFSEVEKIKSKNKVNCRIKNEVESDKKLESFRNLMVEYIKSFKNSDKILHLHSLIGDILVRNRDMFKLYYKDSFYSKPYHGANIQQIKLNLPRKYTVDQSNSQNYPHQNDPFTSMPDILNYFQDDNKKQANQEQNKQIQTTNDLLNLDVEHGQQISSGVSKHCLQNFNICIFFVLSCEIWKC